MPSVPRRRLLLVLLSPQGGAVAAVLGLLILLGCLSVGGSTDSRPALESAGPCSQEGDVHLRPGEERDVYYPEPYVSPPNLELNETGPFKTGSCAIVAQQPTHFRARNTSTSVQTAHWKARGVKGKVVQTIAPTVPPPAPVPVDAAAEPTDPPGKAR